MHCHVRYLQWRPGTDQSRSAWSTSFHCTLHSSASTAHRLEPLCTTRWVERYKTFITFKECSISIVGALEQNSKSRSDDSHRANEPLSYEKDLGCTQGTLKAEYERWTLEWSKIPPQQRPLSAIEYLNHCLASHYPKISILLQIFATLLITTVTPEPERTSSAFGLPNTYLRSVMKEDRLNGLTATRVHREIRIDVDNIIDVLTANSRRLDSILWNIYFPPKCDFPSLSSPGNRDVKVQRFVDECDTSDTYLSVKLYEWRPVCFWVPERMLFSPPSQSFYPNILRDRFLKTFSSFHSSVNDEGTKLEKR